MDKKLLLPTNDYVFKRIFGKKGNEDITRNFIENVTGVRYEQINLEETPILERDLLEKKMGALDVKVVANKYNNIDIEMQIIKSEYMVDRILWYWSEMYAGSLDKCEEYNPTKRTICILVADFNLENLKNVTNFHTIWNIREEKYNNIILTDKLEIHIIELEKLESNINNLEGFENLLNWCNFIKNPGKVGNSIMEENEYIKRAKEELEKISYDEREIRLAELREKAIRDEMAIRDSGFNEGKQEGIKEGTKKGLEQGKRENQIEIAKKMLKENMDIKIISKITELSESEIKELY